MIEIIGLDDGIGECYTGTAELTILTVENPQDGSTICELHFAGGLIVRVKYAEDIEWRGREILITAQGDGRFGLKSEWLGGLAKED